MGLFVSKSKTKTGATKAAKPKSAKAKAPKATKNNFQKWLAYMKKYPPGSTPVVGSDTILITARLRSGKYTPDRTFDELADAYNKNIFPLLRVISDTSYFCPLESFDGASFVFEGALRIEEDPSSNEKTLITSRFHYTPAEFMDETKTFVNTPVDVGLEPI